MDHGRNVGALQARLQLVKDRDIVVPRLPIGLDPALLEDLCIVPDAVGVGAVRHTDALAIVEIRRAGRPDTLDVFVAVVVAGDVLVQWQHMLKDGGDPEFARHDIVGASAGGQVGDMVLVEHVPGRYYQLDADAGRLFEGGLELLGSDVIGTGLHIGCNNLGTGQAWRFLLRCRFLSGGGSLRRRCGCSRGRYNTRSQQSDNQD